MNRSFMRFRRVLAVALTVVSAGCEQERRPGQDAPAMPPVEAGSDENDLDPNAAAMRSAELYAEGRLPEAIQVLSAAVARHPDDPQLWFMLGNAYYRTDQIAGSIEPYVEALRLRPDHVDTALCLGHAYYLTGALERAVDAWERAYQLSPEGELVRLALALGRLYQGNRTAAAALAREVASDDPDWRRRLEIDIRWTPEMREDLAGLIAAATRPSDG